MEGLVVTWAGLFLLAFLIRYSVNLICVKNYGTVYKPVFSGGLLEFIQAITLFLLAIELCWDINENAFPKVLKNICRCSFTIYVILSVFLNVIYKVLNITPL